MLAAIMRLPGLRWAASADAMIEILDNNNNFPDCRAAAYIDSSHSKLIHYQINRAK